MELANVRYLTFQGKPEAYTKPGWSGVVPTYDEAKVLAPLTVDDLLNVAQDAENQKLLARYLESNLELIPIRRRDPNPPGTMPSAGDFPKRVLLELTSQCNLNCVMCPRTVLDRQILNMPKELAKKCIDELSTNGIQGLWLYNIGESMLHPDFPELLDYACAKPNLGSLWLSTNGQQLREEYLRQLIASKLTFINFSLNAMDAEAYGKVSTQGDYDRLRKNLERFFEEKRNQGKVGKTPWLRIQMIDQPQVTHADISNFFQFFGTRTEMVGINKLEAFSQNVAQNIDFASQRSRQELKHCNRIGRGDCFIFADGEVSFCDTDFNHKMSIGNIANSSIRNIWNSAGRLEAVNLNKSGRLNELELCRNCLDYDL